MDPITTFIVILALVACSAFFSGSETSLTAVSRARIYHLVMEGNKRAQQVSRLRRNKESLIGALLLGNNAVNIAASALATSLAIELAGEDGVLYATIIMTAVVLVFGEVLPKTYAIVYSERLALIVAPVLIVLVRILAPITGAVQYLINKILRVFGVDLSKGDTLISSVDALRGAIELHHREGGVVKLDRDMLGSILDLENVVVSEIMIHRKNVEAINSSLPPEEIIRLATNSTHSRIPLWKDHLENIIGVLHVKHLIRALNEHGTSLTREQILAIAARPWFIPDSTTLRDQLLAFRKQRQHFAVVVDEYGAMHGIVTLEDIIEEIVGEIDDELDKSVPGIRTLPGGWYQVEGIVKIRDLNRELDWNLPDEYAATVAGLVLHEARELPDKGAQYEFHGYRFQVEEKKANQITRLRIRRLPREEES